MAMKTLVIPLLLVILSGGAAGQTQAPPAHAAEHSTPKAVPKYGSNTPVGKTFTHDGVKLYYEVYGAGQPLLLVHGNGGSIANFTAQINYFRKRYKVIAMDSRDQGRSSDSADKITYEKMTDDLGALIDHLKTGPVYLLGWSDGGIEALLLGIRHPDKVKKLAAMAANLDPLGIYPEVVDWAKSTIDSMPASVTETPEGKRELKLLRMALEEPHVDPQALETISVPTLILAGDHDMIRDEHTLEIYHHLPNGELCIFPDATHMIPYDDPALFDSTVDHFFRTPYVRKDRLKDLLKSYEAMQASK
jgi:pimeloyl-ACP methyl ester carboxylesterase